MRKIIAAIIMIYINSIILFSQEPGYQFIKFDTLSQINYNLHFQCLSCYDNDNCIMAGAQNGAGARIFKTTDGGTFWKETYLDTAIKYIPEYYPVFCKYFKSGLAIVLNQNGSIIKSVDYGKTWTKYKTLDSLNIQSFVMLDEKKALFTSSNWFDLFNDGIYYSDDSCKTFRKYMLPDSFGVDRGFSTISISKTKDIFVDTYLNAGIKDTTKREKIKMNFAGTSWELMKFPKYILDLYYFNDKIGLGWGSLFSGDEKIPDTSVIYKTYNGGKDWGIKFINYPVYQIFSAIKFWDDSIGYGFGKYNFFIKTTDQGESWYFPKADFWLQVSAYHAMGIEVPSRDIVYLMYSGEDNLYKYCPLTTSVTEPVVNDYTLYPNPIKPNSIFNLNFIAEKSGNAKIYISDINGNEVDNLFNYYVEKGNNSFTFNLPNNISSGAYWLVIEMNGYCHVKMLNIID